MLARKQTFIFHCVADFIEKKAPGNKKYRALQAVCLTVESFQLAAHSQQDS